LTGYRVRELRFTDSVDAFCETVAQRRLHDQKYSPGVRKGLKVGDIKAVDKIISKMMIGTFRKVE
jgi:hypothetical protein